MKRTIFLIALIAICLCVGIASATSDAVPPRLPCEYYGNVDINGSPAPIGTDIIAKIDGDTVGTFTTTVVGEYGKMKVEHNFGGEEMAIVEFYINGVKADETAFFETGSVVKRNIGSTDETVPTTVPTTSPTVAPTTTAPTGTTHKVTGKIVVPAEPAKYVNITPPGAFTWDLTVNDPNDNQITVGNVHVSANCDYELYIQGSTGGYMIGTGGAAMTFPTLKNPVLVFDGIDFLPIESWAGSTHITALPIYHGSSGESDVPIILKQVVVPEDADKTDPTIVFSYIYETL
jgi:hypothetical protein